VAIEVRDALPSDEVAWRRLWSANGAHFGATMPEEDVRELWRRILDPDHPTSALVAAASAGQGLLVGFAHYVLHPHTFSNRPVCYLEDLWVDPTARRGGAGRKLIEALVARGRDRGWRRVYWHTEADNAAGRALYDKIGRLTNYVRYDVTLP
jgi:ribosomal protein S18 acetylase RimI-like enzyme